MISQSTLPLNWQEGVGELQRAGLALSSQPRPCDCPDYSHTFIVGQAIVLGQGQSEECTLVVMCHWCLLMIIKHVIPKFLLIPGSLLSTKNCFQYCDLCCHTILAALFIRVIFFLIFFYFYFCNLFSRYVYQHLFRTSLWSWDSWGRLFNTQTMSGYRDIPAGRTKSQVDA